MNDIYVNAILKSQTKSTQYVIEKSFDLLLVDNKIDLLNYLKNGWNIKGKYHNGSGYYKYIIKDKTVIDILFHYLETRIKLCSDSIVTDIVLNFQEYFDRRANSEGMNVDITIWNTSNKKFQHYRLNNTDTVRDILGFVTSCGLNVPQDKHMLIHEIEIDIKNGKLMCNNAL